MQIKKITIVFKKISSNLNFLFLLNGLFFASCFFLNVESRYEKELFSAIARKIKNDLPENFSQTQFAQKALETTSYLQERRYQVFGNQEIGGLKAQFFHPSTIDLMTNNGACGSYVTVLSRILKANNIKVRIAQMKANGYYGSHMYVEAFINNKWVVLDPTYTLFFQNADSSWATFEQLSTNWNYYKSQVPPDYNSSYKYEGVRYTNWEKIPIIMPVIKKILDITLGKKQADTISIRPYFLRNYHKLTWVTFILWLFVAIHTIKRLLSLKKKSMIKVPDEQGETLDAKKMAIG